MNYNILLVFRKLMVLFLLFLLIISDANAFQVAGYVTRFQIKNNTSFPLYYKIRSQNSPSSKGDAQFEDIIPSGQSVYLKTDGQWRIDKYDRLDHEFCPSHMIYTLKLSFIELYSGYPSRIKTIMEFKHWAKRDKAEDSRWSYRGCLYPDNFVFIRGEKDSYGSPPDHACRIVIDVNNVNIMPEGLSFIVNDWIDFYDGELGPLF